MNDFPRDYSLCFDVPVMLARDADRNFRTGEGITLSRAWCC
jgi:hypothetical protein